MRRTALAVALGSFLLVALLIPSGASAGTPGVTFSNTRLTRPDGGSEPALSISQGGTMYLDGLSWINYQTNVWKGAFGSTPVFQGPIDASIGKGIGGGDADIDLGSTGTLHFTSLMFFFNPVANALQLGVSAVTCPNGDTSSNFANCAKQIIDTTQADRQWVTSDGPHVWISYHDSGNSTLIHVQRSDDDGYTWTKLGDPVTGHGSVTAGATFNNDQGPIVADPTTHDLFDVFAAGDPFTKCCSANFNNIYVARSTDLGKSWTTAHVFQAPEFTPLNSVFPSLAVDPLSGKLYAVWSDAHTVSFSASSDHGTTWSPAAIVSRRPATTAVFPWVAAYNGTVDVVYYGTAASNKDDPNAVWNTYFAQTRNNGTTFTQSVASNTPNHVGVICTNGTGCAAGTRNLLDLFEVAIDPANGKAAIMYTDDTYSTDANGDPLPQVVLAQQT